MELVLEPPSTGGLTGCGPNIVISQLLFIVVVVVVRVDSAHRPTVIQDEVFTDIMYIHVMVQEFDRLLI